MASTERKITTALRCYLEERQMLDSRKPYKVSIQSAYLLDGETYLWVGKDKCVVIDYDDIFDDLDDVERKELFDLNMESFKKMHLDFYDKKQPDEMINWRFYEMDYPLEKEKKYKVGDVVIVNLKGENQRHLIRKVNKKRYSTTNIDNQEKWFIVERSIVGLVEEEALQLV